MLSRIYLILVILCLFVSSAFAAEPSTPFLQKGWEEIKFLAFRNATEPFDEARKRAKAGTPEWVEATIGLALAYQNRQPDTAADKKKAAELYDSVIVQKEYDKDDSFALALILRAKLAGLKDYFDDEPDLERARQLVARVVTEVPESKYADIAALYLAQFDIMTMEKEKTERGIKKLEGWLAKRPDNPLASVQWELIAEAYMYPLGKLQKSAQAYEKALVGNADNERTLSTLYWKIARLYDQNGNKSKAIEYYRRLILELPRSACGFSAQVQLRRLGEVPPPLQDPFKAMRDEKTENATAAGDAQTGAATSKPETAK